jgi:hypothetical protein
MKPRSLSIGFWAGAAALLLLGGAGCSFTVVRPPPLVVGSANGGEIRVVKYPAYVLVYNSDSFWDPHQIKDNLIGLTEGEIVHWLDLAIDGMTPGPRRRPLENRIEWIKNNYAQLPDCAPVRIVGGLFHALGIEKTTPIQGADIAYAPVSPLSYFVFVRVVYLTEWVHETLGEVNAAAGHLAPWPGTFIPQSATAPVNRGVDWTQKGAISLYVTIFYKVDVGLDRAIDCFQAAYGGVIGLFVRR